jgi:hypothetical protein
LWHLGDLSGPKSSGLARNQRIIANKSGCLLRHRDFKNQDDKLNTRQQFVCFPAQTGKHLLVSKPCALARGGPQDQ